MIIDFITFSVENYIKFLFLFLFFYFSGRSFVIVVDKIFYQKLTKENLILGLKPKIIYSIIGTIFVGNYLVLLNFFSSLNNIYVFLVSVVVLIPNIFSLNLPKDLKSLITKENFVYFILIPSVLLISSSDINYHYDAGYYHLNNQNWLRESNLIKGMTNIFWPFGMSSIYEYLSGFLWTKNSLLNLHFLSLIYFQFFYSFLYFYIFSSKNHYLRNGSIFLIFFSILDNFGFSGGRNGFPYIQEVGKQDMPVAILFIFISVVIINMFVKQEFSSKNILYTSIFSFFIFQLKVSGIFIFYLYFFLILFLIYKKIYSFKKILYFQLPTIFISLIWFIKNYLSTGCFIYPLSLTCNNNFYWYVEGSTERVERYTTETSFSFMEYFLSSELNFIDWFNDFFNSSNSVFSTYYKAFYSNFLVSLVILIILKKIFFKNNDLSLWMTNLIYSYAIFSILYLIFFGPIPRYSTGILSTIIFIIGFYTNDYKFEFKHFQNFLLVTFLLSLILLPRLNSYRLFVINADISLYNIQDYDQSNIDQYKIKWVKPESGDRCWIDLNCTIEEGDISIIDTGFFKTAIKK